MYNYLNEIRNLMIRLEALKNMWRKWIDYFKISHIKNQVAEIKRVMDTTADAYLARAANNALSVFQKIVVVSSEIETMEQKSREASLSHSIPTVKKVVKPVILEDRFDPSKSSTFLNRSVA